MAGSYTIGRGKPPAQTRFKPGQSGNPKGRPKGTRNLRTDLLEELLTRVVVTENGRRRTLTKQRALIKQTLTDAFRGDAKARALVLQLAWALTDRGEALEPGSAIAEQDAAILARFTERLRRQLRNTEDNDG